ncbi:ATP-binding protein [Gemmatimonas sp.]|uniref:ATP-binding protein n=1 Tax=Gemmatimonas sp. TaxID=1962908 RepID=UPI00356AC013
MNGETNEARLPWEGQTYSIKRFGTTITNCDSEPSQTPGCIQGHGALLVLRAKDLTVAQVSDNSGALLGHPPQALLGQPVSRVLGEARAEELRAFLARVPVDKNPLYVLTHPGHNGAALDVTVHTIDGVVIVEFEATAHSAVDGPDYFSLIKQSVHRLQSASSVQALGNAATAEIRALTGLDRVMVYKFHEDGHGEVVAESRRPDLSPWLGLHYPAQDIPEPARELLRRTWIRPLREIGAPLSELVPLAHPDTGRPLTMTHCALRGPSVMHTEYLQNMGVTAGLTLSIRRGEQLWGLIAGHHYTGAFDLPYNMRAACELIAQIVSLQHKAAEDRDFLSQQRRFDEVRQLLVSQAAHDGGLSAMVDGSLTLLDAIDSQGAALFHEERWWRIGQTPPEDELERIADWLSGRPEFASSTQPVFVTDELGKHMACSPELSAVASGLLAVPLSTRGQKLVFWFRPETLRTIEWGGNPHDKPMVPGPNGPRLTPRRSFELFSDSVRGRSRPWQQWEIELALRLRLVVMELVISRAEHLTELNVDLARSNDDLDAFAYVASHDLKEPLRGIHKYAHQLSESAARAEPQDAQRIEGLIRLTLRMDSLLDSLLHFSRVGRVALELEDVDLDELVREALEMVVARRGDKPSEVVVAPQLPHMRADRVRLREVFVNLLSNAFKYNDKPTVRIEIGWYPPHAVNRKAHWPPEVTQHAIFYVKDNGIGIEARHAEQVYKMFKRLHGRDEYGGGTGAGLTIVKKLVERHGGAVWFDSEPGVGSTFYISLGVS